MLRMEEYRLLNVERTWSHWFEEDAGHMAHPYDAALETYLADQGVPFHVRKTQGTGWAARRHQLEALERWYASGWSRLDTRLRSSITEGVVVFLSLFDDNPAVHRAFCPPRSAYLGQRRTRRATAAPADRHTARLADRCSPSTSRSR